MIPNIISQTLFAFLRQ